MDKRRTRPSTVARARLRETPRGCELLSPDDRVVFEAVGRSARVRCLRRATEAGVLRIVR